MSFIWDRSSPTRLALGDENRKSLKAHVFPLEPEDLPAPHACVQGDRDDGANVISPASELRKQLLLFICGDKPLSTRTLFQQPNTPHRVRVDQFVVKSHGEDF